MDMPLARLLRHDPHMETLTLLLTDVQGSTRLWAEEADAMDAAMRRHHEIVHAAIDENGGFRPRDQGEGDAVFAAFTSPQAAVVAVAQLQRSLYDEVWPTSRPLRVRAGVHVGEVRVRDGNLFGDPVNRCARIRGAGTGGQTLVSSAVYELVRDRLPADTSTVDLGEHRLKDLVRPERIYQLDVTGTPSAFPPLASLDRVSHNLPVQPTPFIGRERELGDLVASVREHRLVTLTGFGGMGKTRLALQAAAELAGDATIGDVWFVDLTAITDPDLVPARVAEAASVRHDDDPLGALVAAYAESPALFVVDNLEQVLECAPFVVDLLSRTRGVRVLGTSRDALRVRAERIVVIPPLTLPDPDGPLVTEESVGTYEAVRLFLDRAHAVRPDFAVTDANAPSVAAICARLEGSPLALELAAYRLKVLSVETLLPRLDAALSVLTGGGRDMPERHRTLRATIAWSYDALTPDEQTLLARLSILPAPSVLDLVEAVCGDDLDVLSTLESLLDHSLVRLVDGDGDYRYGLLVAIRDYAAEQLTADDALRLRDAHAEHVTAALLTAAEADPGSGASRLVVRILPHVRAALAHRRATPDHRFVDLVTAVEDGLIHLGLVSEYRPDMELAIQLATRPAQLVMLHSCAAMARIGAISEHRRLAFEAAVASGDPTLMGMAALDRLANAVTIREVDESIAMYAEAGPGMSEAARRAFGIELAHVVGSRLRHVDPERAERVVREELEISDDPVLRVGLAWTLLDLGRVDAASGELDEVARETLNVDWQQFFDATLARVALLRGDLTRARGVIAPVFEWFVTNGTFPTTMAGLVLSDLERAADDPTAAIVAVDRALGVGIELAPHETGLLTWRRGRAMLELGRLDAARDDLATARRLLQSDEVQGPLELLGCLAAEALRVLEDNPAEAAALLATIAQRRGGWTLPHFADRDVARIRAALPPGG